MNLKEGTYSRLINEGKEVLGSINRNSQEESTLNVIDINWIKCSFMVPDNELPNYIRKNRYYTRADSKFTDTTMGGNIGINPPPQFTRYCDPRRIGRRSDRSKVSVAHIGSDIGMGRYYSEAIDDNIQTLYLEFGVPKFNSLFSFYSRAVDNKQSIMANTARSPYPYMAGQAYGGVVALVAFGFIGLAIYGATFLLKAFMGSSSASYYSLKPAPVLYWNTVNSIMLQITTELGITIPSLMSAQDGKIGVPVKINQHDINELRELMPDLVTDGNFIDVYAIANRGQALVNEQLIKESKLLNNDGVTKSDYIGFVETEYTKPKEQTTSDMVTRLLQLSELFGYEDTDSKNSKEEQVKIDDPEKYSERNSGKDDLGTLNDPSNKTEKDTKNNFLKYFDATTHHGVKHVAFNVKYLNTVTESFNNSVTEIPAGETLKAMTGKSREFKFNMAGGNVFGETVTAIQNGMKDFVTGALESMTFGLSNIIPALMGGGYIDMPKMWDDSTIDLPKLNFELELYSPYGHPLSQIQRIYLPLSMLLAGTLPLATGRASYTSPMLCSAFLRGFTNISLGMITDLTIERGTGNLGFNRQGRALSYKITFSITDFSSMMSAPVNSGVGGAFLNSLDDENLLDRYIGTITGRSLHTNQYASSKFMLRTARLAMEKERLSSGAYWGMRAGDSIIGSAIEMLLKDTSIENLQGDNQ